jgi:hypothetical protein
VIVAAVQEAGYPMPLSVTSICTVGLDYRVAVGITGNHQDAEDFVETFDFQACM